MHRLRSAFWPLLLVALCVCSVPRLAAAEAEVARSVLLIAAERMADPRFRQSVVLVTRHGRNRATIGVIVNRVLDVPLDRVFPELKQAAQHRLHYGGPVAAGQIVFLLRADAAPAAAITLAESLFISSDGDSLQRLLDAPTPATRLRVFNGFASWAPNQLEGEIDRGDWHLLPVDVDALFNDPLDEMWSKLWRRATQVMVQLPSGLQVIRLYPGEALLAHR
ncbi:MAG: YqgE/AlgH family protein [Sulfuritalea sp.]|nr:YqgE/AlgH family protein [Sulfuritalea sp.]